MEERHQHTTTTGQEANRQTWTTRDHTDQATATSPGQGPAAATLPLWPAAQEPQGSNRKAQLRKQFNTLEARNNHTEAATLLIEAFGTEEEKEEMKAIAARHEANGLEGISPADYRRRYELSKTYFRLI